MKYDDASDARRHLEDLAALLAGEKITATLALMQQGEQLFKEQEEAAANDGKAPSQHDRKSKLARRMRATLEAFATRQEGREAVQGGMVSEEGIRKSLAESDAMQHAKLLDSLRGIVYESDLKIVGHTKAIAMEVNEALQDLIKGGAYDDRKLSQVVEELLALEGRSAAGTAAAGKFAAQEVPSADVPDDSTDTTVADVTGVSIGTASKTDCKKAQKIAKDIKNALSPAGDAEEISR